MEFSCSICEYTSIKKEHVIRHINRKKSCGPGKKEIIEIPVEIKCEFCNKAFSTHTSLKNHQKNNCLKKIEILEKQLKEVKDVNKELEKKLKEKPTTINNTYNILVNNYENTDLKKLTDNMLNKLIEDANEPHDIIPRMIKAVHFNPDIPENHNVYLSNRNRNNKHLQIFKDNHWESVNKEAEVNNMIMDKETHLSDWIDEKGDQFPEAVEKFTEYLDQKYDEETAKLIREEVELVLYNNRHMIKMRPGPA